MMNVDWLIVVIFVAAVVSVWCATGYLKLRGRLQTGDSRKINHVLALAGGALWFGWLPESVARGSAFSAGVLLYAAVLLVCCFRRHRPFAWAFAGNTRESDAPHTAFFFWSSWLISMLALLVVDLLFADMTLTRAAALLVGIGDGVAEPIGKRFGRHRYAVLSLRGGNVCYRTLEGSLSIFIACFAVVFFCYGVSGTASLLPVTLGAVIVATTITTVEALSPHGIDNFTIPVTSAILLYALGAAEILA